MKIIHATCEKENLGVNAYEILVAPEDTPADYAREEAPPAGRRGGVPGGQDARQRRALACSSCRSSLFVCGNGVPRGGAPGRLSPARGARAPRPGAGRRRAHGGFDRERIYALIPPAFSKATASSIDPAFTPAQSGNRYANWLKQMLSQGGRLYEVLRGETPVGFFVVTRVDEQTVDRC